MIVPAPVVPGDTIGVIAPGGAVQPAALAAGVAWLEAAGFGVRLGEHVLARHRYFAGAAAARLADLESMLRDPQVGAVMCARGGYGTTQLLPSFDPALMTAHPKLVIGYSDVSPLLGMIVDRAGVVALHGPMVAADLANGPTAKAGERLRTLLEAPASPWRESVGDVIVAGTATGRAVGGCLSSLVALLGTPYALETAGAVLFLEDVAERPFRIDRMLTHLRLAGKFDRVSAVVLGSFTDCDGTQEGDVVDAVLRDFFAEASFPVVTGFPAGHCSENLAVAFGVTLRVDADAGYVEALAA
jgi:muramoyltetrapeptide carboxypeptidase